MDFADQSSEAALATDPEALADRLRASAAAGAALVLPMPADETERTRWLELADAAGLPLRWQDGRRDPEELAELAQTIATLTGGLAIIEDTAARVLGYSRSAEDVDELRRLSILGRSGPEPYLALLREWGVYDRLAESEQVVEIAEHPASGVRRRLAVGIFAGTRQLGTIWVQQGRADFPPHARQALLGTARLAAAAMLDREDVRLGARRAPGSAELARRQLERGHAEPDGQERTVLALRVTSAADRLDARGRAHDLLSLVQVHAAAFRRGAVATLAEHDDQYTVLLIVPGSARVAGSLGQLARTVVSTAYARYRTRVRVGIGPTVAPDDLFRSQRGADIALRLGAGRPGPVHTFAEVRPAALLEQVDAGVAGAGELRDERLRSLVETEPELARTLARHLGTGAQVSRTAADLGIHQTTVRYRLRRISALTGIDLTDPDERLATQLQLRTDLRRPPDGA